MQEPLVTIVTPSYNQGCFIRATIESVLSQDYPHVEYIVMDGGSTDETVSVVKDYASRLTFISEKDRGQSHAINKGFHMAKGSILAWLNSDDLYLPGCIRSAVAAFQSNAAAGAVYGEGYLIDYSGSTSCRFPHTQPFDLWKLTHLSDYILQQSVYFRKDVLDDLGYLDESLHFTMDWDILIRIGMKYQLEYVPEYMGCLREYPEAKSFAGGGRRAQEIQRLLRRHTGRWLAPGYLVYGLDTYHRIWCKAIDRAFASVMKPVSETMKSAVRLGAGLIISRTINHSQGLYVDGWAGRSLNYMLPAGNGDLVVEGRIPECDRLERQRLCITANGLRLGEWDVPSGDFLVKAPLPGGIAGEPLRLRIEASRWAASKQFQLPGSARRVAYKLKSIRREHSLPTAPPLDAAPSPQSVEYALLRGTVE
jgi:glycosyltransferase involved in cell wall biosynthesis